MSLLPWAAKERPEYLGVLRETNVQGNGQGAKMLESRACTASWPLGSLRQDWAVGGFPGTTQGPVFQE